MERGDAVVIGSGPNGLAAGIVLARAGLKVRVLEAGPTVGGAAASAEATVPGLVHDLGSAVHPLAMASPALSSWPLGRFGLEWIHPPVAVAHPLHGEEAAVLAGTVEETADSLGRAGARWSAWMRSTVDAWPSIAPAIMQPIVRLPSAPVALARFGARALLPWGAIAASLNDPRASALWAGIAAHAIVRRDALAGAAPGLVLTAVGHRHGWPFPRGGAGALTSSLAAYLTSLGGVIDTNVRVDALEDLVGARVIVSTVGPKEMLRIGRRLLPSAYTRALASLTLGPSVVKVDLAVDGGVPWADGRVGDAGTVHLGGDAAAIARSMDALSRGRAPDQPYVLVAQPGRFDASRCVGTIQPVWAYAHLPRSLALDEEAAARLAERIVAAIENAAPGVRDAIRATRVWTPRELERWNASLSGGDVTGGATTLRQLLARPVISPWPYRTGRVGVYLGSASTPPGPGVHGMSGTNAALAALMDTCGLSEAEARFTAFGRSDASRPAA